MLQPSITGSVLRPIGGQARRTLRSSSFRPNVRPSVFPVRSSSSTSRVHHNHTIRVAILAAFGGAIASYIWLQRSILADSRPIEARQVHNDVSKDDPSSNYASPEVVKKVIKLLQRQLKEGQVTVNDDELLSHGVSANTYHTAAKPNVVVYAESTEDVATVMKLAHEYRVPVTPFSGGTSLEGHITCPYAGICVDLSRMDKILEVHEEDSDAVVQAGVPWEQLNDELKERGLELFFPLDPGPSACIGGMIGTGCSGTNAVRYGTAKGEWFLNATVVLPNGEIIKTRQRSRKSSAGYDLTKLFIGAEGTLGIVTEATIRLAPVLPSRVAVCGFPGVEEAVKAVGEVINRGVTIQCVELCDTLMMSAIRRFGNVSMPLPSLDTIFFRFQGADPSAIEASIRIVEEIAKRHGGKDLVFAKDEAQGEELWLARKSAHWSAMALVEGGSCYSTDVCVPVSNLPRLVKETKQDLKDNGVVGPLLGHVGDGNFHAALIFNPSIPGEFEKVDAAAHRMVERAIALDGTCTGEHGVGIGKRQYLRRELGDGTINIMKMLKNTLDPRGIMNPGKLYPD